MLNRSSARRARREMPAVCRVDHSIGFNDIRSETRIVEHLGQHDCLKPRRGIPLESPAVPATKSWVARTHAEAYPDRGARGFPPACRPLAHRAAKGDGHDRAPFQRSPSWPNTRQETAISATALQAASRSASTIASTAGIAWWQPCARHGPFTCRGASTGIATRISLSTIRWLGGFRSGRFLHEQLLASVVPARVHAPAWACRGRVCPVPVRRPTVRITPGSESAGPTRAPEPSPHSSDLVPSFRKPPSRPMPQKPPR